MRAKNKKSDSRQIKARWLSKVQLAKELGIHRETVIGYLARKGAPKPNEDFRYELSAVRAWAAKCAAAADAGNAVVKESRMAKLKEQKLELELEAKRREEAERARMLVPIDAFDEPLDRLFANLLKNLQAKFEDELPAKYPGRTPAECVQLNAAAIDYAYEQLRLDLKAMRGGVR